MRTTKRTKKRTKRTKPARERVLGKFEKAAQASVVPFLTASLASASVIDAAGAYIEALRAKASVRKRVTLLRTLCDRVDALETLHEHAGTFQA